MHEIDRFIDSALALLSRHTTILRVSLINYSFIWEQEKGTSKEQIPMGWIQQSSKEMLPTYCPWLMPPSNHFLLLFVQVKVQVM